MAFTEFLPDVKAAGNLENECETELMCGIADILGNSGQLLVNNCSYIVQPNNVKQIFSVANGCQPRNP